ncbi:MAG TPA: FAD-dependent oxidoreductase [Burkholderiales bacterium]|jgi:rubredoxin-NAD+ reductase|nr:FAD-dependent oxidoreductase [Burkholderiales bacterium]
MAPIIIIGSGLAGYNTARMFRRLDPETPLLIVTTDGGEFYPKPMLSEAFAAGKTPEAIVNSTAEQMAAQVKAIVRPHTVVTAIEPEAKRVRVGEEALEYSKLVLALGAGQVRLPLAGDAAKRVLTVNNLDDYARFRGTLAGKKSVAIVGAGLIGCEFANDLCGAGFRVDLIDLADQPLPRLLPPAGAALLRDRLAAAGVNWHLGTAVKALDGDGESLTITLANGTVLTTDVVLSAIGLRPNCGLAHAAGLKVNAGLVVDRHLETSAPDVYALGDVAEVEGLVLPFIMPITHAARALSATLAGKPTPVTYPAMPVLVKTPACPTIVSPPPSGSAGEWQITQDPDGVKSLFVDPSGRLLGYALNGKATAERAKLTSQLPPLLP